MANNLENHDAFIIIGIDEEMDYRVVDTKNDKNRKNTQNIVDFLKDKDFAGGIRPTVYVKDFNINGDTIDVIVIKNDNRTPYYLTKREQKVNANNIYTRIQDTNTPVDRSADLDKVEILWKKRFGLTQTTFERFEIYLEDYKNWQDSPYGELEKYYKFFPEFTIECKSASDERNGYEYYLFSQYDVKPRWYNIKLKYHQTLLTEIEGVSLDGGRYFTPCPDIDGIDLDKSSKLGWDFSFRYFVRGSFKYKLSEFFYLHEKCSEECSRYNFFRVLILFDNEYEKLKFKDYIKENWKKRDDYLKNIHVPSIPNFPNYQEGKLEKDYENALVFKNMLKDFRRINKSQ